MERASSAPVPLDLHRTPPHASPTVQNLAANGKARRPAGRVCGAWGGRVGRSRIAGSVRFVQGREAILLVEPTTVHKKTSICLSRLVNISPYQVQSGILW